MRSSSPRLAAVLAAGLLAAGAARAGDVTAELAEGALVLRGDDLGAELVLTAQFPASSGPRGYIPVAIEVTPNGGTTLNGVPTPAVFSPVLSLDVRLGDGSDSVQLVELFLDGDLSVDGGGGSNQFYLEGSTLLANCTFKGGDGPDQLSVTEPHRCDGELNVRLGDGANEVRILGGSSAGLSLNLGSGDDEITLDTTIGGDARLSLGAGNNFLSAPATIAGDFSYKGGAGDDTLALWGEVRGRMSLKLGAGGNSLTLESVEIWKSIVLKGGSGSDTVAIHGNEVGEDVILALSAGNNAASVTSSVIGDDLIVKAKSGSDALAVTGNTIGGKTIVRGVP